MPPRNRKWHDHECQVQWHQRRTDQRRVASAYRTTAFTDAFRLWLAPETCWSMLLLLCDESRLNGSRRECPWCCGAAVVGVTARSGSSESEPVPLLWWPACEAACGAAGGGGGGKRAYSLGGPVYVSA